MGYLGRARPTRVPCRSALAIATVAAVLLAMEGRAVATIDLGATFADDFITWDGTQLAAGGGVLTLPLGAFDEASYDLTMQGAEAVTTFGTVFAGSVTLGSLGELEIGITSVSVTNHLPGPADSTFTSFVLGALDGPVEGSITGGTQAALYGGIGMPVHFAALVHEPTEAFVAGSTFDQPFAAEGNIQLAIVPEPGTGVRLGAGLALLAGRRRRPSRAARPRT